METTAKEMVKWKKTEHFLQWWQHTSKLDMSNLFEQRNRETERKNKCERKESWW